jgi:2-keto-4-pentenoate hydratase/2-oxohepta-3-ene-1,7-dioic acid hydratase in catechol pathway
MKIICIGRNYSEHVKEFNNSLPEKPIFFLKPDTALLTKKSPFFYPEFTKDLHYECELVFRICKLGKNISLKFAHTYYDAVGLGIDFTARDLQQECKVKGLPWEIAKSFENSAPLSEKFIPKEELDLKNIQFSLLQNGNLVQTGNSKDMIFDIGHIIVYISQFMTLKIGDLIFTGTPEGVGPVNIGDTLIGFIGNQEMFHLKIK